ncbi:ABC-type multidrug transport system, ATPase component [uncultured Desulfobacterium sp.]|uniref:ABC-type multidrug transport system, ATPase component n=1 Tax=uncultured Desulfobacterium sp. TaxID=201089 RepID=A0A445MX79_9BACT|nr:ABC-type multidrug transport system, ATPase component [uncultured Desulfobacterium sp.]
MAEILFDHISKTFRYGFKRQTVLDNLTLDIEKGEVFGFLGPNGAGKSTSINIALDFIRADSGRVLIKGTQATDSNSRRNIGYMPEHPHFYEQLTPRELLEFGGLTSGMTRNDIKTQAGIILEKLELLPFIYRPVRTFSKGMKQRIGLAQAMIHDPEILILDEPMSGLDPLGRRLISRLILEFKEAGKTVFFSTHILNDVEMLCDRIGVLHKGKLLYCGDLQGFQKDSNTLEEAFVKEITDRSTR